MNLSDLQHLLDTQAESNTLEFKSRTTQVRGAMESLCAFLNGGGGMVLIGISDDKQIKGQQVSDKTRCEIANELMKLAPMTEVPIEYIDIGKGDLQVIMLRAMPDSSMKPYTYDGRAYLRKESTTIIMPRDYLKRLTEASNQTNHSWEDGTLSDAVITDLDTDLLISVLSEGVANGRIPTKYASEAPEQILTHFGLYQSGHLTNAAIVLFAKAPQRWLPQCRLRLARFRGTQKRDFIDSKMIEGNAFVMMDEAMTFAGRYLPIASHFEKGNIERIDEPLFPIDALREVFANAICHRDYSIVGGSISFAIYDDRLEIWSAGMLPPRVTFENLDQLNESVLRNPHIAKVLYYKKYIETWGMGISLIINECMTAGHPKPEFIERSGGVCVVLRSRKNLGVPTAAPEKVSAKLMDLPSLQWQLLKQVYTLGETSSAEILAQLESPPAERTVQYHLAKLRDLGLIDSKRAGKGVSWFVTDLGLQQLRSHKTS